MVDKVKLSPSQFSKRSGGLSVPGSGDVPSLRNLPTVRDVGTEAQASALLSLADDGQRLASMAGEQFNRHMAEVKTLQSLENEKHKNKILLETQYAVDQIRLNTDDAELIPGQSMEAFNNISSNVLDNENLSAYQRQELQASIEEIRFNVASSSLDYQAQLRSAEAEFAIDEMTQARYVLASKNPELLPSLKAEMAEVVEKYGFGLTKLEKAKKLDETVEQLTMASVSSVIRSNPYKALSEITKEKFTTDLSFENRMLLEEMANKQIKSVEAQAKSNNEKARNARADSIRDLALRSRFGIADENGNVPNLSVVDVMEADIKASSKEGIIELLTTDASKTGNPMMVNDMAVKIADAQRAGKTVPKDEIDALLVPKNGHRPISASEAKTLHDLNGKQSNSMYNDWIKKMGSMDQFKKTAIGQERLMAMGAEARDLMNKAEEQGRNPSDLFNPKSSMYVGGELLRSYRPTMKEITESQLEAIRSVPDTDPFEGIIYSRPEINRQVVESTAKKYHNGDIKEALRGLKAQGLVSYE